MNQDKEKEHSTMDREKNLEKKPLQTNPIYINPNTNEITIPSDNIAEIRQS